MNHDPFIHSSIVTFTGMQRKRAGGAICTATAVYSAEWGIVGWMCCAFGWCSVGVLLPAALEVGHELKMWLLCNASGMLLYHNGLQLLLRPSCCPATVAAAPAQLSKL